MHFPSSQLCPRLKTQDGISVAQSILSRKRIDRAVAVTGLYFAILEVRFAGKALRSSSEFWRNVGAGEGLRHLAPELRDDAGVVPDPRLHPPSCALPTQLKQSVLGEARRGKMDR